MQPYLKIGDWNASCDVCGFRYKASQLLLRWDGARTCSRCYETRHPQDMIKVPKEAPPIPWTRPENDIFVGPSCSYFTKLAVPGVGTAGCMIAGNAPGQGVVIHAVN